MKSDVHFVTLLVLFGLAYFCLVLPLFQLASLRFRGRKFVIRLGTPWKFSNPEHRWDVLLSFFSFVVTLGISFFALDFFFPITEVKP